MPIPAPRILIVEDEPLTAIAFTAVLHRLGYEVLEVIRTGEEAVKFVGGCRPDLILMDIALGGEMDGISAAIHIYRKHNLRVIFLTSYRDYATINRANEARPLGYLTKPAGPDELAMAVELGLLRAQYDGEKDRLTLELMRANARIAELEGR